MLEAKDQGHKRKCSPKKKKGLHKNFSGDLKKKGLETKAKDFTFEIKAKDFKICPRGRSWGLHLCFLSCRKTYKGLKWKKVAWRGEAYAWRNFAWPEHGMHTG